MTKTSQNTRSGLEAANYFQQIASEPTRSAWVSANAGSGKTYVLVNRIIRLMLSGAPLEKILCLTFTKAAAAEMSNRLFERLAAWVSLDNEELGTEISKISGNRPDKKSLRIARKLFARSLETPGGLKIQTIHGFCESLLRRFPLEAGLPPGFEVMEEAEASVLKQEARNRVLGYALNNRHEALGEALWHISARAEGDSFDDILNYFQAGREKLIQKNVGKEVRGRSDLLSAQLENLRTEIGLGQKTTRKTILDSFAGDKNFEREKYTKLTQCLNTKGTRDQSQMKELHAALEAEDVERRFSHLCNFFLTRELEKKSQKFFISEGAKTRDPFISDWAFEKQEEIFVAQESLKKIAFFETNRALFLLTDAFHTAYKAAKNTRGKLDFDDLISFTGDLFNRVSGSWVLYKIDGGIDHILVDEAQDTSSPQWQIISIIAEEFFTGIGARESERTLFAVGDEKQSIYSFQGADPDQFDKMRKTFEAHARHAEKDFRTVPLSVSFRSTSQVLGVVDKVFAREEAAKGLTHSNNIDTHVPTRTGQAGLVEVWETIKPEEDNDPDPWEAPLDWVSPQRPEHLLASKIARKIRNWLDKKNLLTARGRPIEPGDILILVRKRGVFFEAMLRALKAHQIPVAGADRMVLSDQIVIKDLVALGRFTLLPGDDLTLACILKSPFFGLSEEELFDLSFERGGVSLWQKLGEMHADIYKKLQIWRNVAARSSAFDFYSFVLNKENGRKKLIARLGEESHDPIDEFLALALTYDQSGGGSLQDFLHRFAKQDVTIKRDMEHGKNEVRLMTVHGAKGLEGNIVFLPETCSVPDQRGIRANFASLKLKNETSLPILMPKAPHKFEEITTSQEQDKEEDMAEYRRLLYVALTRARDRLYICGFERKAKRPKNCWYDLVLDGLANDSLKIVDEEGDRIWRLEDEQTAEPHDKEAYACLEENAPNLPDWAHNDQPLEEIPPRPLTPSRLDWKEEESSRLLDQTVFSPLKAMGKGRKDRFRRGILIHQLLQYLPELEPSERQERASSYLEQNAQDFTPQEQKQMIEQVSSILETDSLRKLFSKNSKAEVPISALIEPDGNKGRQLAINGQIDRLVVDDHDVLIVDYKTNRAAPKNEQDVAPLYVRQMAAYRLILKKIYPDHNVHCALLWTDEPRLMELSENILENALKLRSDP